MTAQPNTGAGQVGVHREGTQRFSTLRSPSYSYTLPASKAATQSAWSSGSGRGSGSGGNGGGRGHLVGAAGRLDAASNHERSEKRVADALCDHILFSIQVKLFMGTHTHACTRRTVTVTVRLGHSAPRIPTRRPSTPHPKSATKPSERQRCRGAGLSLTQPRRQRHHVRSTAAERGHGRHHGCEDASVLHPSPAREHGARR